MKVGVNGFNIKCYFMIMNLYGIVVFPMVVIKNSLYPRSFQENEKKTAFNLYVSSGVMNYKLERPKADFMGFMDAVHEKMRALHWMCTQVLRFKNRAISRDRFEQFVSDHEDELRLVRNHWHFVQRKVNCSMKF